MGSHPTSATGFAPDHQPPMMTRQEIVQHDIAFVHKNGTTDPIDPNYGVVGYKTHVRNHENFVK